MANAPDEAAPWTIKGMPIETRRKATKAAGADGQSVAQFLAEAVELLIAKRAGNVVIPPAPPPALTPDQVTDRIMAVAALQQSMAALKAVNGRASGRDTARLALAALGQGLAEDGANGSIQVARPSARLVGPRHPDALNDIP